MHYPERPRILEAQMILSTHDSDIVGLLPVVETQWPSKDWDQTELEFDSLS